MEIDEHVFISAGVTTGGNCKVGEQALLGVGSVLRDSVNIAKRTFVGAGAVILANTEADGVYIGNPAKKINNKSHEAK